MYSGRETKGTIIRSNFHKGGLRTNISLLESQVAQVSLPGRETARVPPRYRGGSSDPRDSLASRHTGISRVALPAATPIRSARCEAEANRCHVRSEGLLCLGNSSAQARRSVWSRSGRTELEGGRRYDRSNPRETESLKNERGLDFVMLADPTGKITDRFRRCLAHHHQVKRAWNRVGGPDWRRRTRARRSNRRGASSSESLAL
jgi:hypothetical protein